ncbi:MAG: CRISPR-associated endonuclease Cas3'' [Thermoproteota archaeon]
MGLIAFPNESLLRHLEDVTEEILAHFFPKRAILLAKLLKKSYNEADLESIRRAALYTGIFHDVGKAYEPFQKMLKQKGKAPRHEIFSTFFSNKVLTKMDGNLKTIVLLAIAWHHYPTRGMIFERIGRTTSEYLQIDSVELDRNSREELFKILNNIFAKFKCGEEVTISNIPEEISRDDAEKLLDDLGKSIRGERKCSYRTYSATIPLLAVLQIADIKVSFKNRGSEKVPPIYIEDITDLNAKKRIIKILQECE